MSSAPSESISRSPILPCAVFVDNLCDSLCLSLRLGVLGGYASDYDGSQCQPERVQGGVG